MYTSQIVLSSFHGNNTFSFAERKALLGKAEITLPSLKEIEHHTNIELGEHIVLEEIDEQGTLHSCTGLKHIYTLTGDTPIYIFDNHNHALYFRIQYLLNKYSSNGKDTKISLIHIDQHSDLNTPPHYLEQNDINTIRHYTNHICQISTFIKAFLHLYPQTQFERIKSESQLLLHPLLHKATPQEISILDIDLDFRAPEMSIEKFSETIRITRQLIQRADIVTIATSPMFIDQDRALELLYDLLD